MLGHNNPPDDFARVDELVKTADRWKGERPVIETEEVADRAAGFLAQIREESKGIEKRRVAEKKPHIDAGKAVDEKYRGHINRLENAADVMKGLLTGYLEKKEAARLVAEEKSRLEALAQQQAAQQAAREARTIDDMAAAELAAKTAKDKAKEADAIASSRAAVSSSFGGRTVSLRAYRIGTIVDQSKVYRKFKNDPAVIAVLQKLVDAEVRAQRPVPGLPP